MRSAALGGLDCHVPLTRGLFALIDPEDAEFIFKFNWHAHVCNGGTYARTWVRDESGKRVGLLMHKAITGYAITDHRDGDGLNNRRLNLREASRAANSRNSRMQKNNLSGFKGVSPTKSDKWRARIAVDGSQISLGVFDSPEAAHRAYCEASKRLHGDFGRVK